jgi:hypothetical protein
MESKKEIAYRKLVMFYIGLAAATGLGAVVTLCTQANGGAAVAYLCSPDGVTYVVQLMAYALVLSLGCLGLVVAMRSKAQRES